MAITLQNLARRMQVFNLPHDIVCTEDACSCSRQVTGVTDHDPKTGVKTVRALRRKLADSITLTAMGHDGDTLEDLPNGVARVPEILAAEKKRELRITRHDNVAHLAAQAAEREKAAGAKPAAPAAPKPTATPSKE